MALLGDVCQITMGQAPSGDSYNHRGEGLPLVAGAGDFAGTTPSVKKFTAAPGKVSREGDIILGIRASIGERVWSDRDYCLGRGVAGLRPSEKLDRNYLWHWLAHSADRLKSKGRGATFLQVNRADINEMEIPLPPLDEQRRIAAILDKADAVRARRRRALAQLDALSNSIFYNLFGDPVATDGRYPILPLAELVEVERPITYGILKPGPDTENGVPYVRVADMKGGGIDLAGVRRTTQQIAREYRRSTLRTGDLLMSIRGHVGRFASIPQELDGGNITQDSARIAVNDSMSTVYVRAAMEMPGLQQWMVRHTKGVAVRGINLGDLKKLPIPCPPLGEQEKFTTAIKLVDEKRRAGLDQLELLDECFAGLQARSFAGEL